MEDLGIGGGEVDPRTSWRLFAERYHLFRGTPSRMWLDWVFAEVFGMTELLSTETSDSYFDGSRQMSTLSIITTPGRHWLQPRSIVGPEPTSMLSAVSTLIP